MTMSNRHKKIVATLDKGLATDWNDDHEINYMDEISEELLTVGMTIATLWDTSETIGGTAPAWVLVGAAGLEHATVELNTGATTNKISSMMYTLEGAVDNVTSPNDLPVLTMAVQIDTVHTAGKTVEFGFVPAATTPFTANQAGAYFRVNNDTLYAVTGTGAAETVTAIGAYNEYDHYRIEFMSTLVNFYVGAVATPTAIHTTNRPAVALTIKVSVISANNVDSTIRTDAIGWTRLRLQ
jgi:hypothetical protein